MSLTVEILRVQHRWQIQGLRERRAECHLLGYRERLLSVEKGRHCRVGNRDECKEGRRGGGCKWYRKEDTAESLNWPYPMPDNGNSTRSIQALRRYLGKSYLSRRSYGTVIVVGGAKSRLRYWSVLYSLVPPDERNHLGDKLQLLNHFYVFPFAKLIVIDSNLRDFFLAQNEQPNPFTSIRLALRLPRHERMPLK